MAKEDRHNFFENVRFFKPPKEEKSETIFVCREVNQDTGKIRIYIYDEWRYGCMANPIASRKNMIEAKTPSWDPLNQYHDKYGHALTRTYRI